MFRQPKFRGLKETADDEGVDTDDWRDEAFKMFATKWPTWVSDSEPEAKEIWSTLTEEDRKQAIDRLDDYLAADRKSGRKVTCSLARYLGERRWNKLSSQQQKDRVTCDASSSQTLAKPFSKAWAAKRMALIAAGPDRKFKPGPAMLQLLEDGRENEYKRHLARERFKTVRLFDEDTIENGRPVLITDAIIDATSQYEFVERSSETWLKWIEVWIGMQK